MMEFKSKKFAYYNIVHVVLQTIHKFLAAFELSTRTMQRALAIQKKTPACMGRILEGGITLCC